jgi:TetR/AcrR family transcriptional regulator, repressor for uid operon
MGTGAELAPLIRRALSGDAPVGDDDTDRRIIDAVLAELLVTPLRKVALEDIARRAGVTRMTVYRRFGDRERLIEATLSREVRRFLAGVAAADDPSAPLEDRIAEAFAAGLRLAHSMPLVRHMLADDPGELLAFNLADDALILSAGSGYLAAQIRQMPGRRSPAAAQRMGELIARLFVALVLMPPPSVDLTDPKQARRLARETIAPIVLQ